MVYKWCVVPLCTNTTISSPHKLFVSVPTNPKRRKLWLQLARRDPKSILPHTNVFMCEDHFDMEKDLMNFMKYKMGYSQKLLLTDEAVPKKFYCQRDRKRQLCEEGCSREVILKKQRRDIISECLQNGSTDIESSQKDENITPETIVTEELPKTQDNFISPFKVEQCHLPPSQSGIVNPVKRNIVVDENADSDISCFECSNLSLTSSSRVINSDSIDTNENIKQLQCLKNTMDLIDKKPMMYFGNSKECNFLIHLLLKHTNIKIEHILLCLQKIRLDSAVSELKENFGISE